MKKILFVILCLSMMGIMNLIVQDYKNFVYDIINVLIFIILITVISIFKK